MENDREERQPGKVGILELPPRPSVRATCDAPGDDAVVLHVRDGDVSRNDGDALGRGGSRGKGHHLIRTYAQPPCAYYETVVRRFREAVVVRSRERPENLCAAAIGALASPTIRDAPASMAADVCTLLAAKHVAVATGAAGNG